MKVTQNMSVLLWLRNPQKQENSTIMVRVTIRGKRADWSLGKKVNSEHWISGAGVLKTSAKESKIVNPYLNQVRGEIQSHFNILSSQYKEVTPDMVRDAFLGIDKQKIKQHTLIEAFDLHNSKMKEKALIGKMSMKTWRRLDISRGKIIAFLSQEMKCNDIQLNEIKLSFASEFEHFLTVHHKLQSNTTMKYIKILKQILNYAISLEWIHSNPLNSFRCSYQSPDRVVLTQEEIDVMYNKEMPNTRLEHVRDVFIFACYTGYAFSDVALLESSSVVRGIDGEMWIQANRVKTNVKENVMLLDIPLNIINKYKEHKICITKNKLLPVISNQHYNSYLKEIAVICNINKHLTSHIARHTFATTVTLANGISLESVSAMLGHASIKTTQIYAKVVQSKLSSEMMGLKERINKQNTIKEINAFL
jgi:site-specific recombinase XerD